MAKRNWEIIIASSGYIARIEGLGDTRTFKTKRKAIDCAVWITGKGIESYHPEVRPRDLRTREGRASGSYKARDYNIVRCTIED